MQSRPNSMERAHKWVGLAGHNRSAAAAVAAMRRFDSSGDVDEHGDDNERGDDESCSEVEQMLVRVVRERER